MPKPSAPNRPSARRSSLTTALVRGLCLLAVAGFTAGSQTWGQGQAVDIYHQCIVDTDLDRILRVTVTDMDPNGIASAMVTTVAPRPWDTNFGLLKGPIAIRSDYGRLYIMMDGEYEVRGIDPRTGATVSTFTDPNHGNGVGLVLEPDDQTAYSTTSSGHILSIDLVPGPGFGDINEAASGLSNPMGLDINAAATHAYVAEHGASRIARVDLGTGISTEVAVLPSAPRDVSIISIPPRNIGLTVLENGDLVSVDIDPNSLGYGTITPILSGMNDPTSVNIGSSGEDGIVTEGGTGKLLGVDIDPNSPGFGTTTTLASNLGSPGGAGLILEPGFTMLPGSVAPATGSTIAGCVYASTGSTELGSYGATLGWDPNILSFVNFNGGQDPFSTPVVNTSNTAAGMLAFSDADATGASGTSHPLCVTFDVIGARTGPGQTMPLDVGLTSFFDVFLSDLLPSAVVADHPLDVVVACNIGDPIADASINSGDALAILRHELGLPVPVPADFTLQGRCGDLNYDGRSNSTDSNIALSYEVGLPTDPNFPLMLSNVTMETCAGNPCAGQVVPPAAAPLPPGGLLESETLAPVVATLRTEFSGRGSPRGPGRSPVIAHAGEPFELIVEIDAGSRWVGSFGALLRWDPIVAEFLDLSGGSSNGLGSPTANTSEAASGTVRFGAASPQGASGMIEIARVTLRAGRALRSPESLFTLEFTSMAATGPRFESLLPALEIAPAADPKARR